MKNSDYKIGGYNYKIGGYKFSIREMVHGFLMQGGYYTCNELHAAIEGNKKSLARELSRMFQSGLIIRRNPTLRCRVFKYARIPLLGT